MLWNLIGSVNKQTIGRTIYQTIVQQLKISSVVPLHQLTLKSKYSTFSETSQNMDTRIAIGQMRSTNDKTFNREQVKEIVQKGVQQQARFIFLPECCDYVGTNKTETIALAEPLTGDTVNFYKDLAKQNKVWLSLGGIHEIIPNENDEQISKIHNSHVVINSDGEIVDVYRKLHLFDVDSNEYKFRESSVISSGNAIVDPLLNTPLGDGLGLLICYDLRFPEVSTILRKRGAKILTYPSAFAYTTGEAHWETLLRARSIENQTYVIAAAQIGYHNEKRRSYGHAMVVDPWGKIVAQCGDDDSIVDCKTVSINLQQIDDVRQRMPCFDHRRDGVYTLQPIRISNKTLDSNFVFKFEKHIISKSTIFYETALSVSFTNVCCVVPGHVLVASKRCVDRIKDLTNEEIVDFFLTVSKIQKVLEHFYQTTSATVTVQDGKFAGQTVRHVHCHIMPRREGDFEHNDEIYIELNKHDQPDGKRTYRSVDVMSAEANNYRQLIEKQFKD